jgi:hypothetical protein
MSDDEMVIAAIDGSLFKKLLALDFWQPIATAPKTSNWILARLKDGTEVQIHYACDLSGEEQPPFRGWFKKASWNGFVEVYPDPVEWKPVPPEVVNA